MSYVFVKLSHDYADEFNVDCCFVSTKKSFDLTLNSIKNNWNQIVDKEFYFGTNEFLQFYSLNNFLAGMEVSICTEDFYHSFTELAGGNVGYNVMWNMLERINEDNE